MRYDTPPVEWVPEQRCRVLRHVQPAALGRWSQARDDICYLKGLWKPQTHPESHTKIKKTRLFRPTVTATTWGQHHSLSFRSDSGSVAGVHRLVHDFAGRTGLEALQLQRVQTSSFFEVFFWSFPATAIVNRILIVLPAWGVKLPDDRCIFILWWKLGDHILSWFCCWFCFFFTWHNFFQYYISFFPTSIILSCNMTANSHRFNSGKFSKL